MSQPPPKVPEAELDVLVVLRRIGPMPAADLVRALSSTRPMTHGSAATLLARLEAKQLVTRRKADTGKAFVYSATPRAEGALSGTVARLVARLFGGDRMVLVASLLETQPLDAAEVSRLEKLVADLGAARVSARAGGKKR
jgi:predicted transcriptional regulator